MQANIWTLSGFTVYGNLSEKFIALLFVNRLDW